MSLDSNNQDLLSESDKLESIELGKKIYDPRDPAVQVWLNTNWLSGYNPLAVDNTQIRLTLENGTICDYSDPNYSKKYLLQNRDGKPPKFLVHVTESGWVEYALKQHQGMIGTGKETWTGTWNDGLNWKPAPMPPDFIPQKPPHRTVELIFDAQKLKEMGFEGRRVQGTYSDYFLFDGKIPLEALVPTSIAYLTQVMGYNFKIPK